MSAAHPNVKNPPVHRRAFFRNWLRDPFHVASIAPTGRSVARLMATGLGPGDRVIELGAGTGTITRAILETGVHPADLYAVEPNRDFARILARQFPASHIVPLRAESLLPELDELLGSVDYVVSGLPILWFDTARQSQILATAFELLGPAGSFHQMTYWARSPVGHRTLKRLALRSALLGFSPWNIPPAFAFRFEKAPVTAKTAKSSRSIAPSANFGKLAVVRED